MTRGGLVLLVVLATTVVGEGVNDTLLAGDTAANLTTRAGEDDSSIKFLAEASPAPVWRSHVDVVVSRALTHLALDLQGSLRQQSSDTVLFSPLSISGALHLLWMGSRGRTAVELAAVLGATSSLALDELLPSVGRLNDQLYNTSGTQVDLANAMFLQYGYPVHTWFANVSRDTFSTEVYGVQFASASEGVTSQINGWVSSKTKGRISKLFDAPLPASTKMLITNAIYFNGEWEYPFPAEHTRLMPYTIPKGDGEAPEVVQLLMMANGADVPYALSEELNCQVLGLPYKGLEVTMYLVLPKEHGFDAFRALEQNLTVGNMEMLHAATKNITSVIYTVPRMRIQASFHLREAMERLGVKAVFDPVEADLGRMSPGRHIASVAPSAEDEENSSSNGSSDGSDRQAAATSGNPGLFVDDMIHKVEIEVTETGTVASAVTATTITRDGSHPVMKFNRPFLFFIRHEPTGLLLFWGSVIRPVT